MVFPEQPDTPNFPIFMGVGKGETANPQSFYFKTTNDTENMKIFVLKENSCHSCYSCSKEKTTNDTKFTKIFFCFKYKSFRVFRVIRSSKIKISSKKKIRKIRCFYISCDRNSDDKRSIRQIQCPPHQPKIPYLCPVNIRGVSRYLAALNQH